MVLLIVDVILCNVRCVEIVNKLLFINFYYNRMVFWFKIYNSIVLLYIFIDILFGLYIV